MFLVLFVKNVSQMKVDELRKKLDGYDKETIIKLAVEFYKIIPKAKKEDDVLNNFIDNPNAKMVVDKLISKSRSLTEITSDIDLFISHVKSNYYSSPNKVIGKSERPKWRFKVKAFYKDLIALKLEEHDLHKKAELLNNLYILMCESFRQNYFNSDDAFASIVIEQVDFYRTLIQFIDLAEGKIGVIKKGISLITDFSQSRNTLKSELMREFVEVINTPDAKYTAIEKVEELLKNVMNTPLPKTKNYTWNNQEYYRNAKIDELSELGMRLYLSLFEYPEAIQFFKKYHTHQRDVEIKFYIMIRILFEFKLKDIIKKELEIATNEGMDLRKGLIKLLDFIKKEDSLPNYIY